MLLIEIVNESNCKPNKFLIGQGIEFYKKIMQEWLNNDILICYIHNEGMLVTAERFVRTLKAKVYKKVTTNYSKFYLALLNKLVDQHHNTYQHSIVKKLIKADYSVLTKKIQTDPKAHKFKVNHRVIINKYKNNFSKNYTKNWPREMFSINSVLKTNAWTYKIKEKTEKIIGTFYEKQLFLNGLLSRTRQSY